MDISVWKDPNSTLCIRCGQCRSACPHGAIRTMARRKAAGSQRQPGGTAEPSEPPRPANPQ